MLRKPKQFHHAKPCYYCGAPSTSAEHVPPKMMFKHVRRRSSITVPACDRHNSEKGGRDTAIVAGLLQTIEQGAARGLRSSPLPALVEQAIARLHPTYGRAKRAVSLRPFIANPTPGLDVDLPYYQPGVDVLGWAVSLTAALVWSATGDWDPLSDWDNAWRWSPCYFPMQAPVSLEEVTQTVSASHDLYASIEAETEWWRGWSAHPYPYPEELYRFDVSFRHGIVFRHIFFGNLRIYVGFQTSHGTLAILGDAVGADDEARDQAR